MFPLVNTDLWWFLSTPELYKDEEPTLEGSDILVPWVMKGSN